MNSRQQGVHAVIVSYRPEPARFAELLRALAGQVDKIVVVDNAGGIDAPGCIVLAQRENVGVAAAQNAGIRAALEAGASYVLLMDHDSVPAPGMVAKLREALDAELAHGARAAAAGPVFVDESAGTESRFVRFGRLGFRRERCAGDAQRIEADFLIASGTLIGAEAWRDVGPMDEALFIDHVDTDWCLRARAKGWRLYGVCAARMSHRLGERAVRVAGSLPYYVHGPLRQYYTFRNSALLYRRAYAPVRWIFGDALRLLKLLAACALFAPPRLASLGAALRGFADGWRGRAGRASDKGS